jgi:GH24 family phage-related lysozyme (muramidase)
MANQPQSVSPNCLILVATFEGKRNTPYNDVAGNATNGIGHLLHTGPVTAEDLPVNDIQVTSWFDEDIQIAVDAVHKFVTVDLTQNEFDALASWTFNLGAGTLQNSAVLKILNSGMYSTASDHMLLYNKVRKNGVLVFSAGLDARRKAEVALFRTPDSQQVGQ